MVLLVFGIMLFECQIAKMIIKEYENKTKVARKIEEKTEKELKKKSDLRN